MTRIKSQPPQTNVTNCTFIGVQFDAKAVEAITIIGHGLVENAKALGLLAGVLRASNVTVETMLKIVGPPVDEL